MKNIHFCYETTGGNGADTHNENRQASRPPAEKAESPRPLVITRTSTVTITGTSDPNLISEIVAR